MLPTDQAPVVDPPLESFEQDLARLHRVTGWVMLAGPCLFGAIGVWVGLWGGLRVPTAIGLFFLLQASVLGGFRGTLRWRRQAFVSRREDPAAEIGPVPLSTRVLPYLAGLLAIALPLYPIWAADPLGIWGRWPGSPEATAAEAQLYAWGFVAAAILSALFAEYFTNVSPQVAPEARGASCWFRAGGWMALVGALSLFIRALAGPWGEDLTARLLLGVVVLLGCELTLRALWASWRGYFERAPHPGGRIGTDLLSLRLFCSRFNPSASLFSALADVFGMDLRGAWALTFLRRSLEPLAAGLVVVGWLATSFVMIEPSDVGLVECFGKLEAGALRPGLHVTLPWPLCQVKRVPVHRVQVIPIGFTGGREDASMLWTVQHAEEEYNLLLGDGRDLVAINASLHYRIKDPIAYAYSLQNPDATLAILADRVLMQRTVGRSLDAVLSENLAALGEELEQAVQNASDEHDLGFEIVDLALSGLHPPRDVAPAYQAVVAAKVDQATDVLEAEAYRESERPKADGEAARLANEAQTHRVSRLATARGEAAAFRALQESYEASPQAFRLIHYLARVEAGLADRKLSVLDHKIEGDGATIFILD